MFFFFLGNSCATKNSIQNNQLTVEAGETVSVAYENGMKLEIAEEPLLGEEDLSSSDYGPSLPPNQVSQAQEVKLAEVTTAKKLMIRGIEIWGAGYQTLLLTYYLSQEKSNAQDTSLVLCYELGCLLTLLWKKYGDLNQVKWHWFKFIRQVGSEEYFSSNWFEKFKNYLKQEFKDEELQEYPGIIAVNLGRIGGEEYQVQSQGLIREVLWRSLNNFKANSEEIKLMNYVIRKNSAVDYLKLKGAKKRVKLAVIPQASFLSFHSDYAYGIYGSYFSFASKEREGYTNYIYPTEEVIDDVNLTQVQIVRYLEFIKRDNHD